VSDCVPARPYPSLDDSQNAQRWLHFRDRSERTGIDQDTVAETRNAQVKGSNPFSGSGFGELLADMPDDVRQQHRHRRPSRPGAADPLLRDQGRTIHRGHWPTRPPSEMFGDTDLQSLPLGDAVETIIRRYLKMIDSDDDRNAVLALLRSAVSNEAAATLLSELVTAELLTRISDLADHPDAALRASLVVAQLVGIAVHRHVIRVGPLANATEDEIVMLAAPAIERYLA